MFNELSDSACGIVNDERTVFLERDVVGKFGGGMAKERKEDEGAKNSIYSGLPVSHPYIKGVKILSVEPSPRAMVAIINETLYIITL